MDINILPLGVRDSVVGIATRYGLDGPAFEPRRGARFSLPIQTGSGAHPVSNTMVNPGVKRPGRGFNHPLHLAPRLKKE
jgi:hypothetical protein